MPISSLVWLGIAVVFGVFEAATVSLTTIWFAIGAVFTSLVAWANAPLWLQILVFLITSGVCLALLRPFAKKAIGGKKIHTNSDRILGMTGKVTEDIHNINGTGAVYVDGKIWTARSKEGEPIPKDTLVTVCSIEGVKLLVCRKEL